MALQSLFAQLLIKIQEHIKTQVPEIKWIDQDLGQLEWYQERPAVTWPCVLIDFSQTNYDAMPDGNQWGNAAFTLRLGFPSFSPSQSGAPASVKEQSLKYYELEHLLYVAMQGYDADGLIQPVTRITASTERRDGDNFRVRTLVFNTVFEDSSAMDPVQNVGRPPVIIDVSFS